jgi:hypothetical protein
MNSNFIDQLSQMIFDCIDYIQYYQDIYNIIDIIKIEMV